MSEVAALLVQVELFSPGEPWSVNSVSFSVTCVGVLTRNIIFRIELIFVYRDVYTILN